MTNLHDARVAAFKAEWAKADAEGDAGNRVSRGLAAADAVVTVEMITEAFDAHLVDRKIKFDSDGFREWTCMCGNKATADEPHRIHRARAVLALIRGGGEQC